MVENKQITIDTLAGGSAIELFNAALEQVLENIENVNTDHKPARKITLDFIFTSDEERQVGGVEVKCSTKLAGIRGVKTVVFYGRLQGKRMAVEQPTQRDLFPNPQGQPRLVDEPAEHAAAQGE